MLDTHRFPVHTQCLRQQSNECFIDRAIPRCAGRQHSNASLRIPVTTVRPALVVSRTVIRVLDDVLTRMSGLWGIGCVGTRLERTGPKDRRANSNDRGTFLDRNLKIVAHPHRQFPKHLRVHSILSQFVSKFTQSRKIRSGQLGVL